MATAVPKKNYAPYAAPIGETALDTVTANSGNVEVRIEFRLVGTVAQIQADWAALLAATITAPSAVVTWGAAGPSA